MAEESGRKSSMVERTCGNMLVYSCLLCEVNYFYRVSFSIQVRILSENE